MFPQYIENIFVMKTLVTFLKNAFKYLIIVEFLSNLTNVPMKYFKLLLYKYTTHFQHWLDLPL
jgi:hypothetical protein